MFLRTREVLKRMFTHLVEKKLESLVIVYA